MVAALRSAFGPLPDQSMHEKTSVPALIEEIYTFLKQADARELDHLFNDLDEAKANGGDVQAVIDKIDNFETHVVPIIADIDKSIARAYDVLIGSEQATILTDDEEIDTIIETEKPKSTVMKSKKAKNTTPNESSCLAKC